MTLTPLTTLLHGIDGWGFGDWQQAMISGIAVDSRDVSPGDLFCVWPGQRHHGAQFVDEAIRRGAHALLIPTGLGSAWALRLSIPGYAVFAPRDVLPELASRLYGNPACHLRLTGVTGTNGKTTVVTMLAQILQQAGFHPAYWSTAWVNGPHPYRPAMTTPEASTLQRFLRTAVDHGAQDAVLEVSSHAVVLNRIGGLRFRAGIVTNVGSDHLDFHPSLDHYQAAKRAFVAGLPKEAFAILNYDDPVVRNFHQATVAQVVSYGFGPGSDFRAWSPQKGSLSSTCEITIAARIPFDGPRHVQLYLPMPGLHNIANALAAFATATAYGIDPTVTLHALATFRPPIRRLQATTVGSVSVINDVAMNPQSYDAVLEATAALSRPMVIVNAVRGNRGPSINRAIATVLARWNRRLGYAPLILSMSQSHLRRLASDYLVRHDELEAFLLEAAHQGLAVSCHQELPDAIAEGVQRVPPQGILLLLGTFGMDDGPDLARAMLLEKRGP